MPGDPFYLSYAWKQTRLAVLERDHYRCSVPGCPEVATHVDHIRSRKQGGDESASNLRSFCRVHDTQVRENQSGNRNRNGMMPSICDTSGMPLDPSHPWHRSKSNQSRSKR